MGVKNRGKIRERVIGYSPQTIITSLIVLFRPQTSVQNFMKVVKIAAVEATTD